MKKLGATGLPLHAGDPVLIEMDDELTYGIVHTEPYSTPFLPPMRAMKSIVRLPDTDEKALITRLEQLSQDATAYCRAKAAEIGLQLKLVEVYGAMSRRQLTFVYTAEDRIDFRDLVRDLARRIAVLLRDDPGLGYVDGTGTDGQMWEVFLDGDDADALWDAVRPLLESTPAWRTAEIQKRAGSSSRHFRLGPPSA